MREITDMDGSEEDDEGKKEQKERKERREGHEKRLENTGKKRLKVRKDEERRRE